jgi:hypothetical protein
MQAGLRRNLDMDIPLNKAAALYFFASVDGEQDSLLWPVALLALALFRKQNYAATPKGVEWGRIRGKRW